MSRTPTESPTSTASDSMATPSSRGCMALDALSRLAQEFAERSDIHRLMDIVILTLCGQFGVPDVYICLLNPAASGEPPLISATGRWRSNAVLQAGGRIAVSDAYFKHNMDPVLLSRICRGESTPSSVLKLAESGAELAVPLPYEHRVLGLIVMGKKANGKEFDEEELMLMSRVTQTITPLIVNSFLLAEISLLNTWYLDILNSVRQGVFVFDDNFQLKKLNRYATKIISLHCPQTVPRANFPGSAVHHLFPEQAFPGWARHLVKLKSTPEGALTENLVAGEGDDERIYTLHAGFIRRETGKRPDILVMVDDITEQKQNEQHFFNLEKFAEKGVMASSISHELNNFLGLILGGVELSQLAAQKGDVDKAARSLEIVKGNISQMKRFTAGLMDYTRLETSKEPASLNRLIGDVLSFVTVQRKFKGLAITTELDSRVPDFVLDRDQIVQLLLNLLNNAADAVNESGKDGGEITVQTLLKDGAVELQVADNGIGMPEEVRQKLFNSRFTTKDGGHGYGLVTCARIIENHQAEVDISTETGRGTTFIFRFSL